MTNAPDFIKTAVATTPAPGPSVDRLKALRDKIAAVRDDLLELSDLETKVDALKARVNLAKTQELPDMMDELGISRLDLEAEGNHPGYVAQAKPFYRASIAASWPLEKKAAAYKLLDDWDAGDLLKTEVSVVFGRGDRELAKQALDLLRTNGFVPEVSQSVPHTTLTAWLKEQIEVNKKTPPLDVIGAQVGRVVDIKPIKEK